MRRRDFFKAVVGSATAWPFAAQAQQSSGRVVGFLGLTSPEAFAPQVVAFKQGLAETGFVEGQNVAIEYH